LFGGLFPWSVFIPRAVILFWQKRETRLLLIWSLVVFTFFSVSGSKLPPYILPLFPALSIVLGCLFDGQWQRPVPPRRELIVYAVFFSFLASVGLAGGCGLLDNYLTGMTGISSLGGDIRGLSLGMSAVSFAMLFFLARKSMGSFRSLFTMLGAFSLFVVIGIMLHSHVIDRLSTTKGLAAAMRKAGKDNAIVVNYGSFDETLPFYLGKRTYLAEYTGELQMGSEYPDSKGFFLNRDEVVRLFHSDRPVFVVVKAKRLAEMKKLGIEDADMTCQDQRCLIANRSAAVAPRLTPQTRKKDT
jgi:hypothetical protein